MQMSPSASPRARQKNTNESEFADLKFGALIGTGSFGRVYKGDFSPRKHSCDTTRSGHACSVLACHCQK